MLDKMAHICSAITFKEEARTCLGQHMSSIPTRATQNKSRWAWESLSIEQHSRLLWAVLTYRVVIGHQALIHRVPGRVVLLRVIV